ncbi:tRNA-dihydrouridine synthase [Candidatus Gottesmanbacteria bacterium]|nr:tRNA-dihydrouridine synthase [Candidatus Gottesmanbacteria bacterium]
MRNIWSQLALKSKPFLALAPMDGVTDYVFREVIAGVGKPDVFVTEFINTEALCSQGYEKTIHRFRYSEKQRPIVAQIWGKEPRNFFTVAKLIRELQFDGIDINMGCPVRDVMKMGCGAQLINTPQLADTIIAAVKEGAPDFPVSVKTRIGVKTIVTDDWIRFLLRQHIQAITIHGRTAKELSKTPTHWDEIGKAVKLRDQYAPDTVIIGNGGVVTSIQAKQVSSLYGVDGVMIGTGIFQNPWLFEKQSKKHTVRDSLRLLLTHAKLYADVYPGDGRFAPMKKFFKIYVRNFSGASALMKQLMEAKRLSEVESLVMPYLVEPRGVLT